jgi:hypothetical protein
MEVFEYNENFYHIPKEKYELRENYLDRIWYVINRIKQNESEDLNKIIRESKIYSCKKIYGCNYD